MDFMAIASQGVFPTPVPTSTLRAALGVSYGLLNFALPAGSGIVATFAKIKQWFAIGATAKAKIKEVSTLFT